MRVVSWNVNGIPCLRAAWVRGLFGPFRRRHRRCPGGSRAARGDSPAARTLAGWHAAFSVAERRGYSGVGIYSKFEPYRVETSIGEPRFDVEGRFIAAHFRTDRGRFAVVNGYFPKGSGKDRDNSRVGYKLAFYRAVFDRAQLMRRRCPVLVMGITTRRTARSTLPARNPTTGIADSFPRRGPDSTVGLRRVGWTPFAPCIQTSPATTPGGGNGAVRGNGTSGADRLCACVIGCNETNVRCLHLARPARLRPLPGRC